MPKRTWVGVFSLFVFFVSGFCISWFSKPFSEERNAMVGRASRDPAIRKVYDFSGLDGSALSQASKQRILSGFETFKQGSDVGIALGHFVLRGPNGQKQFACQRYSKVILSFEGEGMAVGGEKPTMQIEGPCNKDEDINRIAALMVPVSKIMSQPVADGEFDFHENQNLRVRFARVSDQ
jgi:hypothetical protein